MRAANRKSGSQDGAIAVMAAFVIVIMIAMFGMALDLSRTYNRKVELQSVADAAALAAANALDGTTAGIDKAATAAADTAAGFGYSYNNGSVTWSSSALTFGTALNGGSAGWMDPSAAKVNAATVFFARVDTSKLDASLGEVSNVLIPILPNAPTRTNVYAAAVAGRDSLNVLPFAICANSNTRAASLASGELVEYGFRRGVDYNLMNLNPGGQTPENFLVNPIAPAGTVGVSMMGRMDVVSPFICTGRMAIPTLLGGQITVERSFPIASLYQMFNSRFGSYTSPCTANSAPADPNTRSFDLSNATWMKNKPDHQYANPLSSPDPLLTVAEKQTTGMAGTVYGPLWSYAKAARYASYLANSGVEPSSGYATFATSDWATIYNPGAPVAQSYPGTTPYQTTGGVTAYKTFRNTRVLRIALLQCPVAAGSKVAATVLGIGKFFMTVPATPSALNGEFAGLDTELASGGNARLYQ
ncbi:TadE/TadG family type IV pilus assembly protein [Massilia terrae]|uniref:Pilus assembly protein TadG-related protein n=1 Tax=Massilia terrae TaxID=1811224 RepID=A0ABT2CWJ3_9BURK|nr:pilus assembly protein TadG-related protein [Massilia terrae]MCS0658331.1 pilus assembly protein TadG-related protein [Massilia terrae]